MPLQPENVFIEICYDFEDPQNDWMDLQVVHTPNGEIQPV
jgi:hypothetical protein